MKESTFAFAPANKDLGITRVQVRDVLQTPAKEPTRNTVEPATPNDLFTYQDRAIGVYPISTGHR